MRLVRSSLSLALALAACGDNRTVSSDGAAASPSDARVDASPDAEIPGLATITVHSPYRFEDPVTGYPIADAHISFVWPNGTAFEAVTDSAGQATGPVVWGSSVSVIGFQINPPIRTIETYLDVNPGDQLAIGASQPRPTGSITMNVTFDPVPFASGYIMGACNGGGVGLDGSGSFQVIGYCLEHPFDVALIHETQGVPWEAYVAVARDVVASPGGTVQLSAWEQAWQGRPLHTEGSAPGLGMQVTAGVEFNGVGYDPWPLPPDTSYDGAIIDAPFGDTLLRVESLTDHHWYRLDPAQPSESIDVAAARLPSISAVSFDLPTRSITWTETGPGGERVDAVWAGLWIVRGSETVLWDVHSPRSASQVIEFPELGPTYQGLMPTASDTIGAGVMLEDFGTLEWQAYKSDPDSYSLWSPDGLLQESHHSRGTSAP